MATQLDGRPAQDWLHWSLPLLFILLAEVLVTLALIWESGWTRCPLECRELLYRGGLGLMLIGNGGSELRMCSAMVCESRDDIKTGCGSRNGRFDRQTYG